MQEIGDLEKKQKVRDKYVVDIPVIFLHYYSVFTFGKYWIHDLELSGNLELTHQVKVLSIRQLQQLDFQKGTWRLLSSELGWTFWNRLFGGNSHWSKVRCLVNQNWEVWTMDAQGEMQLSWPRWSNSSGIIWLKSTKWSLRKQLLPLCSCANLCCSSGVNCPMLQIDLVVFILLPINGCKHLNSS